MVLDSLHPEIRDALIACCTSAAFDDDGFAVLIAEYRLADWREAIVTEVYSVCVTRHEERLGRQRQGLNDQQGRLARQWRTTVLSV